MQVYGFDKDGYYTKSFTCQPHPKKPGSYLQPANSTAVVPPTPGANQEAKWDGSSWSLVDSRDYVKQQAEQAKTDALAESKKVILFYRDNGVDDERIEDAAHKSDSWDSQAGEPVNPLNQKLMSDPANSNMDWLEVAQFNPADVSRSAWRSFTKKVVAGAVVARDQADIDTDDDANAWDLLRNQRDAKILEVEWYRSRHKDELDMGLTVGVDTSLDQTQYDALMTYIQELRDFPNTVVDPKGTLTWPTKPAWA